MRLDTAERIHLYNLADAPTSSPMSRGLPEVPHPRVLALFESLNEAIPVVVLGGRGDILAWNHSGHELLFGHLPFGASPEAHRRSSVPCLFFVDPASRDLYRNWEDLARAHVAHLRLTSGRYPRDARLAELIGKLLVKAPGSPDSGQKETSLTARWETCSSRTRGWDMSTSTTRCGSNPSRLITVSRSTLPTTVRPGKRLTCSRTGGSLPGPWGPVNGPHPDPLPGSLSACG